MRDPRKEINFDIADYVKSRWPDGWNLKARAKEFLTESAELVVVCQDYYSGKTTGFGAAIREEYGDVLLTLEALRACAAEHGVVLDPLECKAAALERAKAKHGK